MHGQQGLAPDRIRYYFRQEKRALTAVAVTGIVYNIGMAAGPWFEGQMVQRLADILGGLRLPREMTALAALYVLTVLAVQALRYMKRLYVRRFANNIGRSMKMALYRNLMLNRKARAEETGAMMARIIADADACVEGMRKFTTEVFDTGVVMIAYLALLAYYDWRLTLVCMAFPPLAYLLAGRLKGTVTDRVAQSRESGARLNAETLERVANALTYRVYGQETGRSAAYEDALCDLERKAVRASIWESAMPPVYLAISMLGAVPIIWLGARSVLGGGPRAWDLAAFATYFSVYQKLAVKSSKAARLFNAVQKAQVSWRRIQPYLAPIAQDALPGAPGAAVLTAKDVAFAYPGQGPLFSGLSFSAAPGSIVGLTGEVASGKSTLGRILTGELPYRGLIALGGTVLPEKGGAYLPFVGYVGHQPELMSASIEENILLGEKGDVWPVLRAVCMDEEVLSFPKGIHTVIGAGGVRLSGGQQARIALARALYRPRPLMVLDDPFSAVDSATEEKLYRSLRAQLGGSAVVLISHRLTLFPLFDQVIWLQDGRAVTGTHQSLTADCPRYRALFMAQQGEEETHEG